MEEDGPPHEVGLLGLPFQDLERDASPALELVEHGDDFEHHEVLDPEDRLLEVVESHLVDLHGQLAVVRC